MSKWDIPLREAFASVSDDDMPEYVARYHARRPGSRTLVMFAAFSGRPVALKAVLALGYPVFNEKEPRIDNVLFKILDNWQCSAEAMCAMIDLAVEYGADVNRACSDGVSTQTALAHCEHALAYVERQGMAATRDAQMAVLTAARERLKLHKVK